MNSWDSQYLALVDKVIEQGSINPCRTGNNTNVLLNQVLTHDLNKGFPICTFRQIPFKGACGELSCFLEGITDKKIYEDRKCKYWKNWARPDKIPYSNKEGQILEQDLGPIYGWQWKFAGAEYIDCATDYTNKGIDQIKYIIDTLKKDPYDRRLIVNAWNPAQQYQMALPPCVYVFQLNYVNNKLHMTVNQRSCDLILGVATDVVFYSILLHLICKTVNMEIGTITFNLCNCHVYDNHIPVYLKHREKFYQTNLELPQLILNSEADVFNFLPDMAKLNNYQYAEKVSFEIAI